MLLTKGHHVFMQMKALIILLWVGAFSKLTYQDHVIALSPAAEIAGQLCISECGTCPVICSSPPVAPPSGTPHQPPSPSQMPPPPPVETIQPLLPPPPSTQLPPLLPLLPAPPVSYSPLYAPHHSPPPPPPPPPPSSPPKSSGSSHHPPPPPISNPNVINPGGSNSPHSYYYFYESKASLVSVALPASFLVIVIIFLAFIS